METNLGTIRPLGFVCVEFGLLEGVWPTHGREGDALELCFLFRVEVEKMRARESVSQ
jgi:hypothetical protein